MVMKSVRFAQTSLNMTSKNGLYHVFLYDHHTNESINHRTFENYSHAHNNYIKREEVFTC